MLQHTNIINHPPSSASKSAFDSMNYIIRADKTKSESAQYLFASAFSPSISTFTKAINNENFVTWPGIDKLNFQKLLGTTLASEK